MNEKEIIEEAENKNIEIKKYINDLLSDLDVYSKLRIRRGKFELALAIALLIGPFFINVMYTNLFLVLFWMFIYIGAKEYDVKIAEIVGKLDGAFQVLKIFGYVKDGTDGKKDKKKEKESVFLKYWQGVKEVMRKKSYGMAFSK